MSRGPVAEGRELLTGDLHVALPHLDGLDELEPDVECDTGNRIITISAADLRSSMGTPVQSSPVVDTLW